MDVIDSVCAFSDLIMSQKDKWTNITRSNIWKQVLKKTYKILIDTNSTIDSQLYWEIISNGYTYRTKSYLVDILLWSLKVISSLKCRFPKEIELVLSLQLAICNEIVSYIGYKNEIFNILGLCLIDHIWITDYDAKMSGLIDVDNDTKYVMRELFFKVKDHYNMNKRIIRVYPYDILAENILSYNILLALCSKECIDIYDPIKSQDIYITDSLAMKKFLSHSMTFFTKKFHAGKLIYKYIYISTGWFSENDIDNLLSKSKEQWQKYI